MGISALRCLTAALLLTLAVATEAARAAVAVSVDTGANVRPFSPLIFGVAYGDDARNAVIGYPLRRWGGNSATRS